MKFTHMVVSVQEDPGQGGMNMMTELGSINGGPQPLMGGGRFGAGVQRGRGMPPGVRGRGGPRGN